MELKVHKCECGNVYSFKQGLSKHRKTCLFKQEQSDIVSNIQVKMLIQELEHKHQIELKDART